MSAAVATRFVSLRRNDRVDLNCSGKLLAGARS
jgi:hypothetical protein